MTSPSPFDLVAFREGRYAPLFAEGATPAEVDRLRALFDQLTATDTDVDLMVGQQYLLDGEGSSAALAALAERVESGACSWDYGLAVLGWAGALGAPDALRERVAAVFEHVQSLAPEALALASFGGGDLRDYRDHYESLRRAEARLAGLAGRWPVTIARQWFDFVLARRWAGLDALRALSLGEVDPVSRWLVSTAEFVAGAEGSRLSMIECAEAIVAPVSGRWPRLVKQVAREMASLVSDGFALRWRHLQCAVARDHGAVAVRHWLGATRGESRPEEDANVSLPPLGGTPTLGALSPEPTAAAKAAEEHRQKAGEFLLDWFVPEREVAREVDAWASDVIRLYHRLRGVTLLAPLWEGK